MLYKLVDKNGKVTYAERSLGLRPGDARRHRSNRNTATHETASVDTESGRRAAPPSARAATEARRERRIEEAKKRLDDAKLALADAMNNPSDDDIMRMGNVRGGTRAVWSDSYKARVESLEAQLQAAEEALAKAEAPD